MRTLLLLAMVGGCGAEAPRCTASFAGLGINITADGSTAAWCATVESATKMMMIRVADAQSKITVTMPEPDATENVGASMSFVDDSVTCDSWKPATLGVEWLWQSGDFDPAHWHVHVNGECATSSLSVSGDLAGNVYYRGN